MNLFTFLIIFFFCSFSKGQVLKECPVQAFDQVTELLPNFTGLIQPCSYSGFAPLDKNADSALFYWYFPNLRNDPEAPVLLWLHGDSSFSDVFSCLMGNLCPFSVVPNLEGGYKINKNEELEKYSWIYSYNLIFIDNPVGTGYSYTSNNKYPKDIDEVSEALWKTLQYFIKIHPETLENDWYFGGENHAGYYIPLLSHNTLQYNSEIKLGKREGTIIPLKGNIMGSAIVHPLQQTTTEIEMARLTTMLAPYQVPQIKALLVNCQTLAARKEDKNNEACNLISDYIQGVSGIDLTSFHVTANKISSLKLPYLDYLNNPEVRKVLHAITPKRPEKEPHSFNASPMFRDYSSNSISVISKVLTQIPCLFFVSHFDGKSGPASLYKWVDLLGSPWNDILKQKRNIWYLNGVPVGYWITYQNLTLITIMNLGSLISYFQPEITKTMIDTYLTDRNWDRFKNTTDVAASMCKYMNNCNGHGKCTSIGTCICDTGFFLEDCSLQPQVYDFILKNITLKPRGFLYLNIDLKEGDHFIVLEGENISSLNIYYSYTTLPTISEEATGISKARIQTEKTRRVYLSSDGENIRTVYVTIQNEDFLKSLSFTLDVVRYRQEFQKTPSITDLFKPLGCFVVTMFIFGLTLIFKKKINKN